MFSRLSALRLLAFLLLFFNAQLSLAVHAVEHPFHEHLASCDVFMASEQQHALPSLDIIPCVAPQTFESVDYTQASADIVFLAVFHSRAPPTAI